MSFAGKWMKVETIMLNEISQTQKVKGLYIFSRVWKLERKKENKVGDGYPKNQREINREKGQRWEKRNAGE